MMHALALAPSAVRAQGGYLAILGSALLAAWDADRPDLMTISGGVVSDWRDVVAGYSVSQALGARQPAFVAGVLNGRGAVSGDGVDDYLTSIVFPAGVPVGATPCEIWELKSCLSSAADMTAQVAINYGGTNANTSRRPQRSVAGGVSRASAVAGNGGGNESATDTNVVLEGVHLVRSIFDSGSVAISVDGGPLTSAPVITSTTGARLRLFASSSSSLSGFHNGDIYLGLVTALLPADQAAALTAYMKARGGIG